MNNYHIYDEIGRGKHSVVYKGRRKKSIEYLAVKSTEKSRRKKILNEVLIMHNLDHENVLKFYNWYETPNHLWIIFEYCPGGSLLTLVEQDKKLPELAIREFALDVLKGLYYVHSNGIIFGDLKPSNLYFTEFGVVKLGDFGLARRIIDLESESQQKRGTPFYMAPELFQDEGIYSFYSDFWSLGCVLFELATGSPPFVSSSIQELVSQILQAPVPRAEGFSSEFNSLLAELLHKELHRRITWDRLLAHPFWQGRNRFVADGLPPQPLFDKYLRDNGLTARVDVLRVSQTVQRNLLRESLQTGYRQDEGEPQLKGTDQVVDLGEEEDPDDDTAQSAEPSEEKEKQRPATIQAKARPLAEEERPNSVHARNSSTSTQARAAQFTPAPVEQLIVHSSDITVKPIVGNRDIEKPAEVHYNPQGLSLQVWSREDLVAKVQSKEMEEHFHKLYSLIASATSSADRLNTLNYFESIVVNSAVANKLINSAFIDLLLKLLRMGKSSPLKVRVCSILGTMIRHSTLISSELALSGIFQVLADQLRDKNERVKRKAMAALGEYLFYAATQMDEDPADSIWDIPNPIIALVIRACKPGEDEIYRFYAVKTIENITAQSSKAGLKFAIPEVARFIGAIFSSSKQEVFRASAAVALSHITRLNSDVFEAIVEKAPFKVMVQALADDNTRLQQGVLTMLLIVLQSYPQRVSALVADEPHALPTVIRLMEHSAIVVRGKALLFFNFLLKANTRWIAKLVELKLFVMLEKLLRDAYKYVQSCLHHLLDTVNEIVITFLKKVHDELRNGASNQLQMFPVVSSILNSGAGRLKLNYSLTLKYLSDILQVSFESGQSYISQQVLMLIEALSAYPRVLMSYAENIITSLLPLLLAQHRSPEVDIRFRTLKIFSDIVLPFLFEDSIYDPANISKITTRLMNELLIKQLIPLYQDFLMDQEPVPLYALKLLSALLEQCVAFVSILKRQNLIPVFLENFEGGNSKLNLHLVVIVKRIIESKESSLEELSGLGIVEKVNSVMTLTLQQDWCVEHILDILYELLCMVGEIRAEAANGLADNLPICTSLLKNSSEKSVTEKCIHCISLILQLYPGKISSSQALTNNLVDILATGSPILQRRTLRLVKTMRNFDCPSNLVEKLRIANDQEIQSLCREIWPV